MNERELLALLERVRYTAADLIQLNKPTKPPVSLRFQATRQERLAP